MISLLDRQELVEYTDTEWEPLGDHPIVLKFRARLTVADQEAISVALANDMRRLEHSDAADQFPMSIRILSHIVCRMTVNAPYTTAEQWMNWFAPRPQQFLRIEKFVNARYAAGYQPNRKTPERPDKPANWAPADRLDALQFPEPGFSTNE